MSDWIEWGTALNNSVWFLVGLAAGWGVWGRKKQEKGHD